MRLAADFSLCSQSEIADRVGSSYCGLIGLFSIENAVKLRQSSFEHVEKPCVTDPKIVRRIENLERRFKIIIRETTCRKSGVVLGFAHRAEMQAVWRGSSAT